LEGGAGLRKRRRKLLAVQRYADLGHLLGFRVLPAQVDGGDKALGVGVALDLIQRRHTVACPNLTRIHRVITKLIIGDRPVLKAQQAIARHHLRVEVHLHLGILGNGLQRPRQVFHEDAPRLADVVHVGIGPVALVGELLHQGIVVVA